MKDFTMAERFLKVHCCSMLVVFYIVRLGGNCFNGAPVLIPKQVLHVGGTSRSGIVENNYECAVVVEATRMRRL